MNKREYQIIAAPTLALLVAKVNIEMNPDIYSEDMYLLAGRWQVEGSPSFANGEYVQAMTRNIFGEKQYEKAFSERLEMYRQACESTDPPPSEVAIPEEPKA